MRDPLTCAGGVTDAYLHFFFSSRRRHTRSLCDWSSDVCSSDLKQKSTRLNSSHTVISYAVFCLRSEEHTSELQSHRDLGCRLLLVKKKITTNMDRSKQTLVRVT